MCAADPDQAWAALGLTSASLDAAHVVRGVAPKVSPAPRRGPRETLGDAADVADPSVLVSQEPCREDVPCRVLRPHGVDQRLRGPSRPPVAAEQEPTRAFLKTDVGFSREHFLATLA